MFRQVRLMSPAKAGTSSFVPRVRQHAAGPGPDGSGSDEGTVLG